MLAYKTYLFHKMLACRHNCEGRCQLTSATTAIEKQSARIAIVEYHIQLENQHNLEGILSTFGEMARYDDEPWNEHYDGRDGVRQFYQQLMTALPDLEIEVRQQHVADEAILVEVVIRGTHRNGWRGLPATGRRVEFPLCGIYTFDTDDRLAGEKIYYDRGTVFRQLGVFHEPVTAVGQICTLATHPLNMRNQLRLMNRRVRPTIRSHQGTSTREISPSLMV
jgi:steroid delta-isomerase-like uncharacterized protein